MTIRNIGEGIAAKRQKQLNKLQKDLREYVDWVLEWCQDEQRNSLVRRWELGNHLNQISNKFGVKGLRKLKTFLKEDPSMLHKVSKLAEYYSREDIIAICDRLMADGITHVSYSHMRIIVGVPGKEDRNDILELTFQNCWTSVQLGAHVKKKFDSRSPNPKGRGPAIPKDAKQLISQQIQFAEDFDDRNLHVWNRPEYSLSTQVDKLDPVEYNEDLEKQLATVVHRFRIISTEASKRADEAEKALADMVSIRNRRLRDLTPLKEVS